MDARLQPWLPTRFSLLLFFDVTTLLAALAAVTSNIALVAAAAPDYGDPARLAHAIASLDKISGGRAGWHILADGAVHGAAALGADGEGTASADGRRSLIAATQQAWESRGRAEPQGPVETLGAFERDGRFYSVGVGALRQGGPRRGPLVIHAAASGEDLEIAPGHADVVMSAPAGLETALAFRRDVVARSLAAGRGANDVKIIQGASFVLAPTEEEAVEKAHWIRRRLPESVWDPDAFIGSYAGVAGRLQDFARSGAVDGFTVMPWMFPDELADLVNHLIPELQSRGIYPVDYPSGTLRATLGLPASGRAQGTRDTHALPVIEVAELGDVRLDVDLRLELIVQKMQG